MYTAVTAIYTVEGARHFSVSFYYILPLPPFHYPLYLYILLTHTTLLLTISLYHYTYTTTTIVLFIKH